MATRSLRKCAVCDDTPAKIHYGVLACFGCKGFFRRAVKDGRNKYTCRFNQQCPVTKMERNSCRYCRFRRCLQVGMNPDYVRPDREQTKQLKQKLSKTLSRKKSLGKTQGSREDWTTMLSPFQRKILWEIGSLDALIVTEEDFKQIANFSLKSLIADRVMVSKGKAEMNDPAPSSNSILSIERIIRNIDFMNGFLQITEEDKTRKTTMEDKVTLLSDTFVHTALLDEMAKLMAQKTSFYSEDFYRLIGLKEGFFQFSLHLNHICQLFQSFNLSPTEFSVLKAYLLSSADISILSNDLGSSLHSHREVLQELLFKILKYSRGVSSAQAASLLASFVSFIYQTKTISRELHSRLLSEKLTPSAPFYSIMNEILNPHIDDLLIQSRSATSSAAPSMGQQSNHNMNSSNLQQQQQQQSQPIFTVPMIPPLPCSSAEYSIPPRGAQRPSDLGFCHKLPLTLTKSIEEMLRAPGDEMIMNRPLSSDWADGLKLTPVFSRDVVAHFFPELSGSIA